MNLSNFFTLNWADLGKGIVIAFLTSLLTAIYQVIQGGAFPTSGELMVDLKVAGLAAAAYLLKNLFTNNEGKLLKANA